MNQRIIGAYVAMATKKRGTGHAHLACFCTACEARRTLERRNISFQLMKARHEARRSSQAHA